MAATVTLADASFRLQCESLVEGNLVDDIGGIVMVATGSPVLETSSPALGAGSGILNGIDDFYEAGAVVDAVNPGAGSFSISFIQDFQGNNPQNLTQASNATAFSAKGWTFLGGDTPDIDFTVDNGSAHTIVSSGTLPSTGLMSVVCVYDVTSATGMHIFIDGVLSGTPRDPRAVGDITSTKALEFGSVGGGRLFKGLMDEFVFYKGVVLTADDAIFLHNGGSFRSLEAAGGLPRRGIGRGIGRGIERGI